MAIDISRKTAPDLVLRVVSVIDDAINWDLSYPELSSKEEKEEAYAQGHKIDDLVFYEGKEPTVFVFKHPRRLDVSRQLKILFTKMQGVAGKAIEVEVLEEAIQLTYVGHAEGLKAEVQEISRTESKRIPFDIIQGLLDAGVLNELASVVMSEAAKPAQTSEKK
jgi:hypothetical protein